MNKSFYFFEMAIKLQGRIYKVGSVGLVETQGCFRPETEFSLAELDPPLPVIVPFIFSLTKRSPLQLPSVFFCHGAF